MKIESNDISSKNINIFLLFNIIQPIGIAQFYLGNYKKAIFRLFCFGYSIFNIFSASPFILLIPVTTSIAVFLYVKDFYQALRGTLKDSDEKCLLSPWQATKKARMKVKEEWIAGKSQYEENLVNLKQENAEFKKNWIESKEEMKDIVATVKNDMMAAHINIQTAIKGDLPYITTQEEFDQLKSGDQYINSDGDRMEKP
tara:strand:- start:954 stop:1550 length:597 start_codon:yes stop_codon:yes gene_type:complete